MSSRYDRADPGTDPAYTDGLHVEEPAPDFALEALDLLEKAFTDLRALRALLVTRFNEQETP